MNAQKGQDQAVTATSERTVLQWDKLTKAPTVGVIGGGQLAQMLYQSAISLGIDLHLFASPTDEAAPRYFRDVVVASSESWSPSELYHFASKCDIVTFDHELVSPMIVRELEKRGCTMLPSSSTLEFSANKAVQREQLHRLGFPLPDFQICNTEAEAASYGERNGWPIVVKISTGGYDGRGVFIVDNREALSGVLAQLGSAFPLVVEPFLTLEAEGSVLAVRSTSGECKTYPMVRTVQADGICREVISPSDLSEELSSKARNIAAEIASELDVFGILAVEFFVVNGELLVNELAPRPHNTGHITIEANVTSQFENHLRAVLGLPIGSTELKVPAAAMVNLITDSNTHNVMSRLPRALSVDSASVHLYSKSPKKERKVGHVTAVGGSASQAIDTARSAVNEIMGIETISQSSG